MKGFAITCITLTLAIGPASSAAQEATPPAAVTPASVAEGERLFRGAGLCFACHGPAGRGVPGAGPDLTDAEWLHVSREYEELVSLIEEGVPADKVKSGALMPPKGGSQLTDEQIRAVAAYVWSLGRGSE